MTPECRAAGGHLLQRGHRLARFRSSRLASNDRDPWLIGAAVPGRPACVELAAFGNAGGAGDSASTGRGGQACLRLRLWRISAVDVQHLP